METVTHLARLTQEGMAQFETLDRVIPSAEDDDLARRHAPLIRFDTREPFLPQAVGYTVFRAGGPSPSFPREIALPPGAVAAIEYAIWWDWEIQHLYELEHIWVFVGADVQPIAADASWHGGMHPMLEADGSLPMEDGRVRLFSEPGKHAFAPVADWLLERKPITDLCCGRVSGIDGVLVTPAFEGFIHDRNPINNQLVHTLLERLAFAPTYDFSQRFDLSSAVFVPWPSLFRWIPTRITWWVQRLSDAIPPGERRVERIAHRGASAYAQEGSTASIHKAFDLGADRVEVDIRTTRDGVPIIAHDADLMRVYGVPGAIADLTLDEIRALAPSGQEPPLTFEAMAALCQALSLGLYLDVKDVRAMAWESIRDSLRRHHLLESAIFGSFHPDLLADLKQLEPKAVTSILFSSIHVDPAALARAVHADYVHPCWERFESPSALLTEEWIARVREAGLGIVCWHEERPQEIEALQARGVNAVCSDQPELLMRHLRHSRSAGSERTETG